MIFALFFKALCIISYAAFAIFYVREEESSSASIVKAAVGFVIAGLITWYIGVIGGAIAIAATFYVADRKNRSRGWAALAFLLGPITLLVVVCLPKLADTSSLSLSLTEPPDQSSGAAQGGR